MKIHDTFSNPPSPSISQLLILYLSESHLAVSRHRAILQFDATGLVEDTIEAEYLAYLEGAVRKYDQFMERQTYIPFTTYEQLS